MSKTIRFGDLVRQSGRPEAVTLWTDPKKDPGFSKAMKENRVVTIHTPPSGHRKEFGEIGFYEGHGATYLVFPRPLPKHADSRVVGINYQLAEDTPVKGALARPQPQKERSDKRKEKRPPRQVKVQKSSPTPPKPEPKIYNVIIRRTAVLEEMERVRAFTEQQARESGLRSIKHKRFILSRAVQRDEVISSAEAQ